MQADQKSRRSKYFQNYEQFLNNHAIVSTHSRTLEYAKKIGADSLFNFNIADGYTVSN